VLVGSIATQNSRYQMRVRVLDAASGKAVAVLEAPPSAEADVLSAVGALAGRIRNSLGDTTNSTDIQSVANPFVAESLPAMRDYSQGRALAKKGRYEEAIAAFKRAIDREPQCGRAYAGWALTADALGRYAEASEHWNKALALTDRMTDREKYRTLARFAYRNPDRDKARESFEVLTHRYPAEASGHSTLSILYFVDQNFAGALDEVRRATDLWPGDILSRMNHALYAMYSSDFVTAAKVANAVVEEWPSITLMYLPIAICQVMDGKIDTARDTYRRMRGVDARNGTIGLADLALFEGRPADARAVLARALAEGENGGAGLTVTQLAMAEALLDMGDRPGATAVAGRALARDHGAWVFVPVVRLGLAPDEASSAYGAELARQAQKDERAYGGVIEGNLLLRRGKVVAAIDTLRATLKLDDLWLAHFDLGVAYVHAGLFAEALSELETCQKRRGEATAIFLDEMPTVRYLAPLRYWLGRANEGLQMMGPATEYYKAFVALRPDGTKDPLAIDARKRLASR